MSDSVLLDTDDRGVATVTLNRPDKHNAFDDEVIAALAVAFDEVAADPAARAMVLASNGRSFSAGADLGWMKRMAGYSRDENHADAAALAEMLRRLNEMPVPTIAAVQGPAYGGAVGLVSCCDLAVGGSRASFCLSEVRIGLIPATISPYVIGAIGARAARRYFLTAEVFDAAAARDLGLLTLATDDETIDNSVESLLATLLDNGPLALRAAKRLVLDYAGRPIDADLIADSCARIADIRVSPEGQAGLGAFFDKTPAPWKQNHV